VCRCGKSSAAQVWALLKGRVLQDVSGSSSGAEMNRIQLVVFCIHNRTFAPCLEAIYWILIPVLQGVSGSSSGASSSAAQCSASCV
jgi:hypothetical protein